MAKSNQIGLEAILDDKDFAKGIANYTKSLDKAESHTKGIASSIGGALGGIGRGLTDLGATAAKLTFAAAAAGAVALAGALKMCGGAAMEAQDVEVQLNAILKTTGKEATNSKQSIMDYANAMSQMTKFDDEAIVSAESLLLTFDNISGATLPAATTAAMNLATTFKIDLVSATKLVGKALSSTEDGVSELARMGVKFSESENEMIKAMTAAGDVAGAQAFVLKTLEDRMGGTAVAAGTTASGGLAILKTTIGNLTEGIGMGLIPIITSVAQKLNEAFNSPAMQAGIATLSMIIGDLASGDVRLALEDFSYFVYEWFGIKLGPAIDSATAAFNRIVTFVQSQVIPVVQQVAGVIQAFVTEHAEGLKNALIAIGVVLAGAAILGGILAVAGALMALVNPVTLIIGAIALLAIAWTENWGGIQEKTQAVLDFLMPYIQGAIEFIQTTITTVIAAVTKFWTENGDEIMEKAQQAWSTIMEVVSWATLQVQRLIGDLTGFISANWETIRSITDTVWNLISGLVQNAVKMLQAVISLAMSLIRGDWDEAWEAVKTIVRTAWENIKLLISSALEIVKDVLKLAWEVIEGAVTNAWAAIRDVIGAAWLKILGGVRAQVDQVRNAMGLMWSRIYTEATNAWNNIKSAIMSPINEAKGIVIGAIDAMKGALDSIKNIHITLPHFTVQWQDLPVLGHVPSGLSVEWYGKGLAGQIFNKPTLIGVGESGPEMVSVTPMSGGNTINNNYNLSASYRNYESEGSLRDSVRLMQAGVG